jgi:hypothetical protein
MTPKNKMEKLLKLFLCAMFFMNSCAVPVVKETTETNLTTAGTLVPQSMTSTPIPTETLIPTITPTPTATAYAHHERSLLSVDMVKNINASLEISLDENGNIVGLPDDTELLKKKIMEELYKILAEKFIGSQIYYDEDPESEQFVLIVILGGTIFHRLIINNEGNKELYDFPTTFGFADNGLTLVGDYSGVSFPGKNYSVGVVWDNGIPQLVSNRLAFPNGDSYFTHYLIYNEPYAYTAMLWREIPGIAGVLEELPSFEDDLNPRHVQSMSYEYKGVLINADFITDDSIVSEYTLNRVTISESIYAEYIARTLFHVWWKRGEEAHTEKFTQRDFNEFMSLWSKAQESGLPEDWAKVQINNIWANDLSDGTGYDQKPYSIWPMYDGETTEGIRGFNKFSIVLVGGDGDKYITKDFVGTWEGGFGANLDKKVLKVYMYHDRYIHKWSSPQWIGYYLSKVSYFLITNVSNNTTMTSLAHDSYLDSILSSALIIY